MDTILTGVCRYSKRDVINEKLMNLMNRLRAEVKPANATIVACVPNLSCVTLEEA